MIHSRPIIRITVQRELVSSGALPRNGLTSTKFAVGIDVIPDFERIEGISDRRLEVETSLLTRPALRARAGLDIDVKSLVVLHGVMAVVRGFSMPTDCRPRHPITPVWLPVLGDDCVDANEVGMLV